MKPMKIRVVGPTLSKIVQQLLFDSGMKWNSGDKKPLYCDRPSMTINVDATGGMSYGEEPTSNGKVFDAATQMGELIDFIDGSKEIVITSLAHETLGMIREGKISPDGKILTVGCSTITYEKVKETYEKMTEAQK